MRYGDGERGCTATLRQVTCATPDEATLITALRARDEVAFAELVDRHTASMLSVARGYVPNAAIAEEVVPETWIALLKGSDRFEGRSSLRTWLYKIASNACFDQLRSSQRRARPMDLSDSWAVDGPIGEILPEVTWM